MKALIVYDTKFGMTEKIAQAILVGMKEGGVDAVDIKKAEAATEADFKAADAWIFGAPVHIGGPTGEAKRALKMAIKSGAAGKKGAAFDTRYASAKGKGAAGKMSETMAEGGVKIVAEPQWFVVTAAKGPLAEGEEAKAKDFGRKIAEGLKA